MELLQVKVKTLLAVIRDITTKEVVHTICQHIEDYLNAAAEERDLSIVSLESNLNSERMFSKTAKAELKKYTENCSVYLEPDTKDEMRDQIVEFISTVAGIGSSSADVCFTKYLENRGYPIMVSVNIHDVKEALRRLGLPPHLFRVIYEFDLKDGKEMRFMEFKNLGETMEIVQMPEGDGRHKMPKANVSRR